MACPLSQATTKQTLVARMRAGPQADHKAPTQFLGPTPASSTLHPASRRTMKILVPVRAKPAARTMKILAAGLARTGTRIFIVVREAGCSVEDAGVGPRNCVGAL